MISGWDSLCSSKSEVLKTVLQFSELALHAHHQKAVHSLSSKLAENVLAFWMAHSAYPEKSQPPSFPKGRLTHKVIPRYHLFSQTAHTVCLCKYKRLSLLILLPYNGSPRCSLLESLRSVHSSGMYSQLSSTHLSSTGNFLCGICLLLLPFIAFTGYIISASVGFVKEIPYSNMISAN